ncbi:glycosyltransferase family A protein [Actinokineospora soli]
MTDLDVLIPTRDRPTELATTLAGLAAQDGEFGVVVSDQSDGEPGWDTPSARAMAAVLRARGAPVRLLRHLPRRGIAEQRAFLFVQSSARFVLFLDDDVWLAPGTLPRLRTAITALGCGLVGAAVQGMSYLDDERPDELAAFEEWTGPPEPERIEPGGPAWRRWTLHNAANPAHLTRRLGLRPGEWRAYKIAWVGGCVLYDRAALVDSGGFGFWRDVPPEHCGEDVVAQWRVMARAGGAGILPSGAVHLEAATTVPDRRTEVRDHVRVHPDG